MQGLNYGTGTMSGHQSYHQGSMTGHQSHMGQVQVSNAHGTSVRKVSEVKISDNFVMPSHAYEQSSRMVSSVVVHEELEKVPEKKVRYVEVPQYEEVLKMVPMKEIREVEKIVPKVVEEWVERIVEIPQIEEVIRHVEVPQVQEVIKQVPKIEIIDRPYEVIKEVPKIQINKVEKVVDLAAETIEVPKQMVVEERVAITNYENREAMLIVSQKVKPVIIDGHQATAAGMKEVVVDVVEYEPEVMPVDIHVAKFVDQELVMLGAKETIHRVVTVSAAQYNSMLRYLNVHLNPEEVAGLPYLADAYGQVSFLPQEFQWFAPQEGMKIYGYVAGRVWGEGQVVSTAHNTKGMSEAEIRARQSELDRQFQQIFQQFEQERVRRVNAIEEFNRRAMENVRMQLQSQGGHSTGMSYSSAMPTGAISYDHSGYDTHY